MMLSRLGRRAATCALLCAAAACNNFLDVNTNPNSPTKVGNSLILPAIEGTFSLAVIGSWPSTLSAEWTQQISYNGSRANMKIEQYEIFPSEADRLWNVSYDQIMGNARILAAQADASGDYAYSGIARVLYAWDLSVVANMWGSAPFSQAWDPSNPHPGYDTQQQIYTGVFAILDSAIADLGKPSNHVPGADDLLYGGNMARWLKLANTLKAQLELTVSSAPGENKQARAQAALVALQGGFTSNADDANFAYFDANGQRNPLYQSFVDTRLQMSKHYVDLLTSTNDPRLPFQASPTRQNGGYVGHPNGGGAVDTATISSVNPIFSAPNAKLTWMSYASAKEMEAEARLIVSGASAADAAYRAGISANMAKLGVSSAAQTAYLATVPSLASSSDPLRDIITQKYIINFMNYQPWDDWRRTGYPALTPVPGALLPQIPVRFLTPGGELSTNADAVAASGIDPGLTGMLVHVWWDPQ